MRRMIAVSLAALTAVAGLSACGKDSPTRPSKSSVSRQPLQGQGGMQQPGLPLGQGLPGAAGAQDPRVAQMMQAVDRMRQTNSAADIVVKLTYYKDNGEIKHVRSRYKFQKPKKNHIEVLGSNEPKVVGTKVSWNGNGKADVRTKFIGFWVTVSLDLHDDRLRDQRGNFLDETSIDRSIETLLAPGARITYKGEGTWAGGKPMNVFDVVSPLSLKPTTREVYGIDPVSCQPCLREMYKGDKLIWKMQLESAKVNPTLSSKDFAVE